MLIPDLDTIWMFPKIVLPQNGWFIVENPMNKWMIWEYHYFWKYPYTPPTPVTWWICVTNRSNLQAGKRTKRLQKYPMDPEKKSLNFIFPTKYVIPKSLKFSHWPSKKLSAKSCFWSCKGKKNVLEKDLFPSHLTHFWPLLQDHRSAHAFIHMNHSDLHQKKVETGTFF